MCLKAMFGIGVSSFATETVIYDFLRYLPLLLICAVAATPLPRRLFEYLRGRFSAVRFASPVLMAASFLLRSHTWSIPPSARFVLYILSLPDHIFKCVQRTSSLSALSGARDKSYTWI